MNLKKIDNHLRQKQRFKDDSSSGAIFRKKQLIDFFPLKNKLLNITKTPHCHYSLHLNNINGVSIINAELGQKVNLFVFVLILKLKKN